MTAQLHYSALGQLMLVLPGTGGGWQVAVFDQKGQWKSSTDGFLDKRAARRHKNNLMHAHWSAARLAARGPIVKTCKGCGKAFVPKTSAKSCSPACSKAAAKAGRAKYGTADYKGQRRANKKWREKNRDRLNEKRRERYANDPEYREKKQEANRTWKGDRYHARIAERKKQYHEDEEFRECEKKRATTHRRNAQAVKAQAQLAALAVALGAKVQWTLSTG